MPSTSRADQPAAAAGRPTGPGVEDLARAAATGVLASLDDSSCRLGSCRLRCHAGVDVSMRLGGLTRRCRGCGSVRRGVVRRLRARPGAGRRRSTRLAASWRAGRVGAVGEVAPGAPGAPARRAASPAPTAARPGRRSAPAARPSRRRSRRSVGVLGPVHELLRLDPPVDRVVQRGRAQVLRDREDVAAGVVQVARCAGSISSGSSPIPRMRLDLVTSPAARAIESTRSDLLVAERRPDPLEDPRHRLQVVREHLGAGVEDLADQLGPRAEVGRQDLDAGVRVRARGSRAPCRRTAGAAPSGWSSRATPVTVAYRSPSSPTDSATRRGSSTSSAAGRPVAMSQKSQRRVQTSPPIRNVASRSSQHSKMLGQPASWQTVCRPPSLHQATASPCTRAHRRRRPDPRRFAFDRRLARCAPRRAAAVRPSGATVTGDSFVRGERSLGRDPIGRWVGRGSARCGPRPSAASHHRTWASAQATSRRAKDHQASTRATATRPPRTALAWANQIVPVMGTQSYRASAPCAQRR